MVRVTALFKALRRRQLRRLAGLSGAALNGALWPLPSGAQSGPGKALPDRLKAPAGPASASPPTDQVSPAYELHFPRDHGAHPGTRTEWWYLTGVLRTEAGGPETGFQLTFFRSRSGHGLDNPSRFAPRQFILGHVALASAAETRLIHDQSSWRSGFERVAGFSEADCELRLPGWSLRREDTGSKEQYLIRIRSEQIQLDLQAFPDGPPLLQGQSGFSRKGPSPHQASHYYSRPQMRVAGRLAYQGKASRDEAGRHQAPAAAPVQGLAWMDHEWSNEILDEGAAGWDWMGLNLDDGSSLMAFRIRARTRPAQPESAATLWSEVRWVERGGAPLLALPADATLAARSQALDLEVLGTWQSLRSGARYPVALRLKIAATARHAARHLELRPLMPDQEVDARKSTGGFYWEGLVFVFENGKRIGQGYLELTGYAGTMKL